MQENRLKEHVQGKSYRVLRGESWRRAPSIASESTRFGFGAGHTGDYLGFRLVRNITHEGELNVQDSSP